MTAALITMIVVLVAAVIGVGWLWRREIVDRRAAEQRLVERGHDEGERVAALYERILALREQQAVDLMRLATTGSTLEPSARVQQPEPTAQEILSRTITEETIATGMVRMREEYERAGIAPPPDDVLREEVEMILAGALPPSGEGVLQTRPLRA